MVPSLHGRYYKPFHLGIRRKVLTDQQLERIEIFLPQIPPRCFAILRSSRICGGWTDTMTPTGVYRWRK